MKRRVVLLVLAVLAALVTVLPTAPPVTASVASAARLAAPVAAPVAARVTLAPIQARVAPGTRIDLEGRIAGPRPRRYVVQQRRGGRWTPVARDRTVNGEFLATVTAPRRLAPVSWRVVVPQVRRDGRLLPRRVSRVRTTRVVAQQVRFRLPTAATVGTTVQAFVRFTPYVARQGVRIYLLVNGHRQLLTSKSMRPGGALLRFRQGTTGTVTYQVTKPGGGFVSRTLQGRPDPTYRPTRRLSVTTHGAELSNGSTQASASDDGHLIAFVSSADNAVPGDTNQRADVFVKDTTTGSLRRVTHGIGTQQSNGDSSAPAVSGDGRFVAFVSRARNLVPGDRNDRPDVFVWERATGEITRVGLDASEPVLNADGRDIAFTSHADGTSRVVVVDRVSGTVTPVSTAPTSAPAISDNGGVIAYNAPDGIRLWDRAIATITLAVPGGRDPHLDADGSVVAYEAAAGDHRGVYALDRGTSTTTLLATDAVPDEDSTVPSLLRVDSVTADGSQVLLTSNAVLTADDEDYYYCESESECYYRDYAIDAFVADVATASVTLVSRSATGEVTDFFAEGFDLLADGSGVVFGSRDVLVPGQTSRGSYYSSVYAYLDVFVRDLD